MGGREPVDCRIRRLFRRLGRVGWTPTSRNRTPTSRNRTPTSRNRTPTSRNRTPTGRNWTPKGGNRTLTGRNRTPTSAGWTLTGRNRTPTSAGWRLTIIGRTPSYRNRSLNDLEPTPKPVDRGPNLVERCPLSPCLLRNRPLLAFSVPLRPCGSILFRERHRRRFTTEARRHREGELREEVDGASGPFCPPFHSHECPPRERNNYFGFGEAGLLSGFKYFSNQAWSHLSLAERCWYCVRPWAAPG